MCNQCDLRRPENEASDSGNKGKVLVLSGEIKRKARPASAGLLRRATVWHVPVSRDAVVATSNRPRAKKRLQSAHGTVVCGDGGEIPMAELANKYPQNVAGKYFVDDQCIDCDLCRETAPANFTRNDDGGHSYVYKQPETPEEEALCKEAQEGCPVEAIGDDGE
jgi:ferredoxin